MSHQKVIELANKMISKIADLVAQNSLMEERARLSRFRNALEPKLFAVASEIEGDVRVLWERQFDHKEIREMMRIHREVLNLYNSFRGFDHPAYLTANKLIHFVLESPGKEIIDRLIVRTDEFIKQTNVDTLVGVTVTHPKNLGLRKLKALANVVKSYVADHPLIQVKETVRPPFLPSSPGGTEIIPPESFDKTLPSAGNQQNQQATNPAIPAAKKAK